VVSSAVPEYSLRLQLLCNVFSHETEVALLGDHSFRALYVSIGKQMARLANGARVAAAFVTLQAVPVVKDLPLPHTSKQRKNTLNHCYARSSGAH